jgi:hypothetical protein
VWVGLAGGDEPVGAEGEDAGAYPGFVQRLTLTVLRSIVLFVLAGPV